MEYIGKMMWIGREPNKERSNPKTYRVRREVLRLDEETFVESWSVKEKKVDRKRFIKLAMSYGIQKREATKCANAVRNRKISYLRGYRLLEEFLETRFF